MPAPKVQILYRRDGDICFGWLPLDNTVAQSYKLYSSSTPAGIYSLLKSIPNVVDKSDYQNKVVTFVKDSDVPIPPLVRYYFKLTYVDLLNVESNINLSPLTIVFPAGVALNWDNEAREANSHDFAWNETNQRWEKLLVTADGKLIVDAGSITIGNVKIAARPDGVTLEYVLVDNNRRIVVSEDPTVFNRFRSFGQQLAVVSSVETSILTYTNISAFYLDKIICTGTADAKFTLKINGSAISILRNSWNNRNVIFDFTGKSIYCNGGDSIVITALHTEISNQEYEADLTGFLYSY
jgi:hypothetical protein